MDNIVYDEYQENELFTKIKQINALDYDELMRLDAKDRIAMTHLVILPCNLSKFVNIMAPKVWFESKEDFKEKLTTDLLWSVMGIVNYFYLDAATSIGKMVDSMGIDSLYNYLDIDKYLEAKMAVQFGDGMPNMDELQLMGIETILQGIMYKKIINSSEQDENYLFKDIVKQNDVMEMYDGFGKEDAPEDESVPNTYVIRFALNIIHFIPNIQAVKEAYYKGIDELVSTYYKELK